MGEFQLFSKELHQATAPKRLCPLSGVTWYRAVAYCRWLSEQEGIPEAQMCYPPIEEIEKNQNLVWFLPEGYLRRTGYRLPTEAEWEYACRAGALTSRCYGGADKLLGEYAWYRDTSNGRTWPVGTLKPNDFGLFDMYGNVWEWCQDIYYEHYTVGHATPQDGSHHIIRGETRLMTAEDVASDIMVTNDESRVLRGGAFTDGAARVRSAYRYYMPPAPKYSSIGFRVARTWP